jgi:hypothetical protein
VDGDLVSVVVCRTEDCLSAGRPVEIELSWVDETGVTMTADSVVCGACSQPITDVTDEVE